MAKTKFEQLSLLVLADTLAALPMEHMVRLALLGHERLRQTSCLKWVTDRMTNASFRTAFKAHQEGGVVAAAFSTNSFMKRVNGKVDISLNVSINDSELYRYLELAETVPGWLHFFFEVDLLETDRGVQKRMEKFTLAMQKLSKVTYISQNFKRMVPITPLILWFQEMVFEYRYYTDERRHAVFYRPSLLKGRHVVDLLNIFCWSSSVLEVDLNRIKTDAKKRARTLSDLDDGLWYYKWRGSALTLDHKDPCEDVELNFRIDLFEPMTYDDVDDDDDDSYSESDSDSDPDDDE